MSVQLDFNPCSSENCKNILLYETTGAYDSTTNTTGWGTPNEATTDATAATLEITFPESTGSDSYTTVTINLYSSFPTSNSTQGWLITNTDLGLDSDALLPSGDYTYTYSVTTGTTTYTQTIKKFIYCNLECCVAGLFADIGDATCDCSSDKKDKALEAFTYLVGLCYAANCGNLSVMTNYYDALSDICDEEDCNCG